MSNRKETAAFSDQFLKQQNKLEIRIAEEVRRLPMGKHGLRFVRDRIPERAHPFDADLDHIPVNRGPYALGCSGGNQVSGEQGHNLRYVS